MKRLTFFKLLQKPGTAEKILKKLHALLRNIPVKRIVDKILPKLTDLGAKFGQWINAVLEFAMKKVGKIPAFK